MAASLSLFRTASPISFLLYRNNSISYCVSIHGAEREIIRRPYIISDEAVLQDALPRCDDFPDKRIFFVKIGASKRMGLNS